MDEIKKLKKEIARKKNEFNVVDNIRELECIQNDDTPVFLDIVEDKKKLNNIYKNFKHGASFSSILLCPANDKCPHYEICPFKDSDKFEEIKGKKCPFEYNKFVDIVKNMSNAYGIESVDYVAYQYILEYAELEIIDLRLSNYINKGKHAFIMVQEFKAVTENGDVVFGDEISKAYEIKERIKNRKDKILKMLLMTPESKAKVKSKDKGYNHELSKYIDTLKKAAESLIDLKESTNINLNDIVEGEIVDE